MKSHLILLLTLVISACSVKEPRENIVSKNIVFTHEDPTENSTCIDTASTTFSMADCYKAEIQFWEKEVVKYFDLLLAKLPQAQQLELEQVQLNWKTYVESEKAFNSTIYDSLTGTIYLPYRIKLAIYKYKHRALELKGHYLGITGDAFKG